MLNSIAGFPPGAASDKGAALAGRLRQIVDAEFVRLRGELTGPCRRLRDLLPGEHATLLQRELDQWLQPARAGWTLINAADPCGT